MCLTQSDQLGKMSWRGIHFDLKEGHLEGHLALNVASSDLELLLNASFNPHSTVHSNERHY